MRAGLLALVALDALCGCGNGAGRAEARGLAPCTELVLAKPPEAASVVILLHDTMRRDVLRAYGGPVATPQFEAFARDSLLFEHAVSQSPWTKPSIATLFTSLHPSQHGVLSHPRLYGTGRAQDSDAPLLVDLLPDGFVTLAEVLAQAGFRTAAFVDNPWLDTGFGFAQGFETYERPVDDWNARGGRVVEAALSWLARRSAQERFFLYVHLIESHLPYGRIGAKRAQRLRERFKDAKRVERAEAEELLDALRLRDGRTAREAGLPAVPRVFFEFYRAGIVASDRLFGELLAGLRALPAWERTALLVLSDHGEALYERGYGNHGGGLYSDETDVPFAARLPGVVPERGRVSCPVGLIDVMPSLCDYLGVRCPAELGGWSFLRRPAGSAPDARRFLVTEGVMNRPEHRAIRDSRYKLLYEPAGPRDGRPKDIPWSLYDLTRDPGQRDDLLEAETRAAEVERAFAALREALPRAVSQRARPPAESVPLDPTLRRRLRELGYLGE